MRYRIVKHSLCWLTTALAVVALSCSSHRQSSEPDEPEGEATSNAVPLPEQCQAVTSIEVVHRVNGVNVTDRLRLVDDAASVPGQALRAFQNAASHFGVANVVSSRPITQVMCFPQQAARGRAPAPPPDGLCVNADGTPNCSVLEPSHTYDYSGTETCTILNRTESVTMTCDDSSAIVTRHGDVVLSINTQSVRDDIAAKTQALRKLVGDQNVITNFHFDISVTPDQAATIVSNTAFNGIAQAIKQASDAGQPLPDIQGIIHDLPDPTRTINFYTSLVLAWAKKAERVGMLAQITNGNLLSPSQVNAFYQNFVGNSKLVDKLEVNHSPTSLNQAANTINNSINQLAATDPSSTIYKQLKAGTQSLMQGHTSNGVYDPDHIIDFAVPNLFQSVTDGDLDKRLAAAEALSDLNHQIQQPNGRQRAHDMNASLKRLDNAMQIGDAEGTVRLLEQTKATEFFFDHTSAAGTEFDIHLTPEAQAMFGIAVEPTSAKAVEVILIMNTTADLNAQTGQVTLDFTAVLTLNLRRALLTDDLYSAAVHSEESWGILSFLKNVGAATILAGALAELAADGVGIIEIITDGWDVIDALKSHLRGSVSNWQATRDLVWQIGQDLIRHWPGMTPEQAAALVNQIAGQVLQALPPAALGAAGIHEAIEAAVRLHLDKAAHGLEIIDHSGVVLPEDAAVELVKDLQELGVTDLQESIEIADVLDNDLPCSIVGTLAGTAPKNITAPGKPPCTAKQIAERYEKFKDFAAKRGVTTPQEVHDLVLSGEGVGPLGEIVDPDNKLLGKEKSFVQQMLQRNGGTYVGPHSSNAAAIDGYFWEHPAQLKVADDTADVGTAVSYVGKAWAKAKNYRDISVYVRCQQFTRQQIIDTIPGRFVADYMTDGKIHEVHYLGADGWVDVILGVIQP